MHFLKQIHIYHLDLKNHLYKHKFKIQKANQILVNKEKFMVFFLHN
jgi:hypothetical protein